MRNKIYKKLSVFILLAIGGFLLVGFLPINQAKAATFTCNCFYNSGTVTADNFNAAQTSCQNQCEELGGFVSLQTIEESSGTCDFCCCNNGSTNSGAGISCYSECLNQGGIQSSNTYQCNNPPASPPSCEASSEDLPGGGTTSGGQPLTRIGNVVMPNFLICDSVSACITNIANFIINYIAMPLAVFMIILAGFRFVLAQGNDEKLQVARKNFIWTAIGVAIVFASNILIIYIQELLGGSSGGTLTGFINRLKGTLNLVIGVLFSLTTAYFIWGIIQYVVSGGDEKKLEQGKKHMVWGIIGMAIMGAAWGIVTIIKNYIGT